MSALAIWITGLAVGNLLSVFVVRRILALHPKAERTRTTRLLFALFPGLTILAMVAGNALTSAFGAWALVALVPLTTALFSVGLYALMVANRGPSRAE